MALGFGRAPRRRPRDHPGNTCETSIMAMWLGFTGMRLVEIRPKAISRPSGDHDGYASREPLSVRRTTRASSTEIAYRLSAFAPGRLYAIHRPSGDHVGPEPPPTPYGATTDTSGPSAFTVHICAVPGVVRQNAILAPSEPGREPHGTYIPSDAPHVGPVRGHRVDVPSAAGTGHERDPVSVGRPRGVPAPCAGVCKPAPRPRSKVAYVGFRARVDVARVRDRPTVGRPRRREWALPDVRESSHLATTGADSADLHATKHVHPERDPRSVG
jgi:hypothetical protein